MAFVSLVAPRFNQLDPAGILFFGEIFPLCSGVYEDFLVSLGFMWEDWFINPLSASPVRHAEAEYLRPIKGGQAYEVEVEILTLRSSAFEIGYTVRRHGVDHCLARIVHVFIDPQTQTKMPIPPPVREAFIRYGIRPSPGLPS